MKLVKVAAAALNQTPLDWDGNRERIVAAVRDARDAGVAILCLPELCITGYGCEDAFLAPGTRRMARRVLDAVIPQTRGLVVNLGLPVMLRGAVYNATALVHDGRVLGVVAKRALAGDGIHYEPRWFKPWPRGARSVVDLGGAQVPVGDLRFVCGSLRIGFEICEDAWSVDRPGADLAHDAVDIILNPSASHFAFGKYAVRERLAVEGSRAFGVTYIYANLLGNEAGRVVYDGDMLIASGGEVLARGERFSFDERRMISAVVDIDVSRTRRAWITSYRPRPDDRDDCVVSEGTLPAASPGLRPPFPARQWTAHVKEEEFTRAVALALFDYLRKTRSHGWVVSMSGGADSSAVACLAAFAVRLAIHESGLDRFKQRLSHVSALASVAEEREAVGVLLTGAYQSTRNSSETTRSAARTLARALGAQFHELDVDAINQGYCQLIGDALGRPLTWEDDDLALQNIQARVRSPGIWMLANVKNALLLSTSNRSEAAVGYATMDGDTSGGVSPIAGIDKAFLRHWLQWVEGQGPTGLGPVPELRAVNEQQPTAELRPNDAHQTDEADLMPYPVLDAIERAAIRDKQSPADVCTLMRAQFPELDPEALVGWVRRFFVLWSRNQWKRERYAPSFHLDDANLDPKTWCRWPILSGGFGLELDELEEKKDP